MELPKQTVAKLAWWFTWRFLLVSFVLNLILQVIIMSVAFDIVIPILGYFSLQTARWLSQPINVESGIAMNWLELGLRITVYIAIGYWVTRFLLKRLFRLHAFDSNLSSVQSPTVTMEH